LLDSITTTFAKNLPKDNSAEYQMVNALKGVVSDKTLLQHISIVENVEDEIKLLDEQAERNADLYGFNNNANLDDETEENKDK
jgi:hypothetical protein